MLQSYFYRWEKIHSICWCFYCFPAIWEYRFCCKNLFRLFLKKQVFRCCAYSRTRWSFYPWSFLIPVRKYNHRYSLREHGSRFQKRIISFDCFLIWILKMLSEQGNNLPHSFRFGMFQLFSWAQCRRNRKNECAYFESFLSRA